MRGKSGERQGSGGREKREGIENRGASRVEWRGRKERQERSKLTRIQEFFRVAFTHLLPRQSISRALSMRYAIK